MGDGGPAGGAGGGEPAALYLRLDGAEPHSGAAGRRQRIHLGAHEAFHHSVGAVVTGGMHRPTGPRRPAARPWIGAAGGPCGHPGAVLHLSGNFGPGDHVGGCTDFPAGGAAGLLGQLERSGPAGAGRAGVADLRRRDAAGGVGAGHLVDLRTAPAAAVRGSHRRKPGHPTAVGLRVGETACKM